MVSGFPGMLPALPVLQAGQLWTERRAYPSPFPTQPANSNGKTLLGIAMHASVKSRDAR
jgi:hypothetical protein